MSSIGFDGKLEPAFVQHILIGRVEHQPLHDGMNEIEPFQHHAYMFTGICRMLDAMLRVMLGVTLHASSHKSSISRFMPLIMLYVLLLGMIHAACDVSFHFMKLYVSYFMLHVMLLRGMIIVMLLCFIPCAFPNYRGCQAWTSVDKC